MNARELALHAYYLGTSPYRLFDRARRRVSGRAPLCVLFYHRVADSDPNDWSISNDQFRRQMLWLKRHFDVVSLAEIQRRMRSRRNDRTAVAITFDDGYAENCEQAIPFLIEQQIPATYFVSLDFVVSQRPFPHDAARGCPLPVNTPEQIRWMADAGIEIGAHTRTHCDIGAITDVDSMVDEVVTASEELAAMIDRPLRYFAFPYGQRNNLSAAAVRLARQSGFWGVCSAYGAYNYSGNDPYHIQRIHADPQFIRLKNWLTVDPRKTSHGNGYEIPETAVSSEEIGKIKETSTADATGLALPVSLPAANQQGGAGATI